MRPLITQGEIEQKIAAVLDKSEEMIFALEASAELEAEAKHALEIGKAKAIIRIRDQYEGKKITVDEKGALALVELEDEHAAYLIASARMDALRVKARLIGNEADLLRTLAANLRPLVTAG